MRDFWRSCGYELLDHDAAGRLVVTDDYLRAYYERAELAPNDASCDAERSLHASLMESPRRAVSRHELADMRDEDARENYEVMLRFRDQLLAAPTLEAL